MKRAQLIIAFFVITTSLFFSSCTQDELSSQEELVAVAYNSLKEYSYYGPSLAKSYEEYTTPAEVFYALPDILHGSHYSYYTEAGGVDGWPWPLFSEGDQEDAYGMILNALNDTLYVQKIFSNSGAEDGGLRVGDKIIAVDSFPLYGNHAIFDAATSYEGNHQFIILRDTQLDTFVLYKEPFTYPIAYSDSLTADVGYIYLSTFHNESTAEEFNAAMERTKNFKATIIDLRDNGGGYLDELDHLIDQFLEPYDTLLLYQERLYYPYTPYYAEGYVADNDQYFPAKPSTIGTRKFVLLLDRGSASASEMLAVSLLHNLNTPIVGDTSYGKAIGQAGFDLSEWGGGFGQTTVMKMKMANGKEYHTVGIVPTYLVEESTTSSEDVQLSKAIEVAYLEIGSSFPTKLRGKRITYSNRLEFHSHMAKTPKQYLEFKPIKITRK